MIRVQLPYHLQTLARVGREVELQVEGVATLSALMDALETRYPVLRGTVRDQVTGKRRDFIRFFACGQDMSLDTLNTPLPEAVVAGREPFRIVGAMAGG
jgi:molybdopterin synthase sulfur carrier subunit